MDTFTLLILCAGATTFFLAVGIYQSFFAKRVKVRDRFEQQTEDPTEARRRKIQETHNDNILKQRKGKASNKSMAMEVKLERANMMIQPGEFSMICMVCAVITGLLTWAFSQNIIFGVIALFLGFQFPHWYMGIKTHFRMAKAEEQFSDVLDSMVSCLKTGLGFSQSVNTVTENFGDPWGTEFGKVSVETSMGLTQKEVLNNLYTRLPNPDVEMFVTAMQIYSETGGNLVELLGNLSVTIRTRYKLLRKVSTLSAQGKLSAMIIILVPFVIAGIMSLAMPEACLEFVTNPIGIIIIVLASIWMAMGIFVLFKIVQIQV